MRLRIPVQSRLQNRYRAGWRARACPVAVTAGLVAASLVAQPYELGQPLPEPLVEQAWSDRRFVRLHLLAPSDPRIPLFIEGGDLHEVREGRRVRRGLVLTPYQRVQHYREGVFRPRLEDEAMKSLIAAELWIVAVPYSRARARALLGDPSEWDGDPLRRLEPARIPTGEEVFWPKSISLRVLGADKRRIEPLWVETGDLPFSLGLADDWVAGHSVVAAFPLDDPAVVGRKAIIEIEGFEMVSGGRSWNTTETFRLGTYREPDWQRALAGRRP